ncbi:MAG: DUF1996 domain-containing protein [Ilumatobacteraceae bacterium]
MRSRRPSWVDVVAAAMLLAGCSTSSAGPIGAAPDRVIAGPQGAVGQFVVECGFDRFRADDPIVHPGDAGASHLHQFFGAHDVAADSVAERVRGGETTCDQRADTASYWAPALIGADGPIEPTKAVAYYRAGPDVDPLTVVPYPPGFMIVAGDHTATDAQPTSVVAFGCGTGGARTAEPSECGVNGITLTITFQDCWNGVDVRSSIPSQPALHVSYSRSGSCPSAHPVSIPQLQLAIEYPATSGVDPATLALTSGDIHSGHADFWNTWDEVKLRREVERCITRDLVCGVSG